MENLNKIIANGLINLPNFVGRLAEAIEVQPILAAFLAGDIVIKPYDEISEKLDKKYNKTRVNYSIKRVDF